MKLVVWEPILDTFQRKSLNFPNQQVLPAVIVTVPHCLPHRECFKVLLLFFISLVIALSSLQLFSSLQRNGEAGSSIHLLIILTAGEIRVPFFPLVQSS